MTQSASETRALAIDTARSALQEFRDVVKEVEVGFAKYDFVDVSPQKADEIRAQYESRIDAVGVKNIELLVRLKETLTSISESLKRSGEVEHLDLVESLDIELESLREQTDTDAELVQLGLAVAVINHEFEASIKGIRRKLSELSSWAKMNSELFPLYQDIRTNFDHLDAHLNLFTPLQRRLQRKRIEVKGSDINHYIQTLFHARFKRHDVNLNVSHNFLISEVFTFPSTIYPVFVNIIDNAIFWLKDVQAERIIALDFVDGAYHIGNNGPSITKQDFDSVFEKGFSRKPEGRGLGLFISRNVLRKEGLELNIISSVDHMEGTTFEIKRTKDV